MPSSDNEKSPQNTFNNSAALHIINILFKHANNNGLDDGILNDLQEIKQSIPEDEPKNRIDVNQYHLDGTYTFLHYAIQLGCSEAVGILLTEYNANSHLKTDNDTGDIPLDLCDDKLDDTYPETDMRNNYDNIKSYLLAYEDTTSSMNTNRPPSPMGTDYNFISSSTYSLSETEEQAQIQQAIAFSLGNTKRSPSPMDIDDDRKPAAKKRKLVRPLSPSQSAERKPPHSPSRPHPKPPL